MAFSLSSPRLAWFRWFKSAVAVCLVCTLANAAVALTQNSTQASTMSAGAQTRDVVEHQGGIATFHKDVRMVLIPVTVQGTIPAGGLQVRDFSIIDSGEAQKIASFDRDTERPVSIVLAVDSSLSTASHLSQERDAALSIITSLLHPRDSLSLFDFNDSVTALTPFTSDRQQLIRAVHKIQPEGGTSLYDMIFLASRELRTRQGRKALIIISDGGDTTSGISFQGALREAMTTESVIYSIIVVPIASDSGRDIGGEHALEYLSQQTGGESFAADANHLESAIEAVFEALRHEYLIGYYPHHETPDGRAPGFHDVAVQCRIPGLTIFSRKGYYRKE